MTQHSASRRSRFCRAALHLALLIACPALLAAQEPPLPAPAASYQQGLDELKALWPRNDRVAEVRHLVLERDGGRLTFEEGSLALLSPVSGRTIGAVFMGRGPLLHSATRVEREQLRKREKKSAVEAPFTELVLLFSDRTLAELEAQLRFTGGAPAGGIGSLIEQTIEYLSDYESHTPDPDVMLDLLNANLGGMFYAHIGQKGADPLMFMINPRKSESVVLLHRTRRVGWSRMTEVAGRNGPGRQRRPATGDRRAMRWCSTMRSTRRWLAGSGAQFSPRRGCSSRLGDGRSLGGVLALQ
jgi:hypothetical protein